MGEHVEEDGDDEGGREERKRVYEKEGGYRQGKEGMGGWMGLNGG